MHVSLSFLYSTTLASALYLLLLRYLARQYKAAIQLVDTVSSDTSLTDEESATLRFMTCGKVSADDHPDAHALRLKISLVLLDSPISLPWDLSTEVRAPPPHHMRRRNHMRRHTLMRHSAASAPRLRRIA